MQTEKKLTGYPSLDRPWLKYYPQDVIRKKVPAKTMYRFIYDSNIERLDNIAIAYFDKKITYREMFANIKQTANAFRHRGIKKGDIISIISLNTPETIYCMYALNAIGAVANLMSATITKREVLEQLKNTDSKMLVVLDKILEKMGEIDCGIPVVVLSVAESAGGVYGAIMKFASKKNKKYECYKAFVNVRAQDFKEIDDADAPAIIIYTSGSTGVPKGVVLTNNNLNAVVFQVFLGKHYRARAKFLNILPPFIGFGIAMQHACFFSGMINVPCLIPNKQQVKMALKKYSPEHFAIGPAILEVIDNYDGDLSFLIDLGGGGEAIALEKEEHINKCLEKRGSSSKYFAGYGMTELGSAATTNIAEAYKLQSVGIPLLLTNIKILSLEDGTELSYNQEGELLVSGPGLMRGYYKNESETESVIEIINGERWIHTGDLAKIDEDGFVFITGRLKRIYTAKGEDSQIYKIFPQRMEEIVEQIEAVEKCGVIVIPDGVKKNVPVIFVTTSSKDSREGGVKASIIKEIEEKLPDYYRPKDVVILKEMPITLSQKIDYRLLEQYIDNI